MRFMYKVRPIFDLFPKSVLGLVYYHLCDKVGYLSTYTVNAKAFESLKSYFNKFGVKVKVKNGVYSFSKNHPLIVEALVARKFADSDFFAGFLKGALDVVNDKGFIFGSGLHVTKLQKVIKKSLDLNVLPIVHRYRESGNHTYRFNLGKIGQLITNSFSDAEHKFETDLDFAFYGWILADGHLTPGSSMGVGFNTSTDSKAMKYLLPIFQKYSGNTKPAKLTYVGETTDVYAAFGYTKSKISELDELLRLKSYKEPDLRVPEIVFKSNLNQQASFISAVFCADGTCGWRYVSLTSASFDWLRDIQLLLLNFGIHCRIQNPHTNYVGSETWKLQLKAQDGYRFLLLIGFRFSDEKQLKLAKIFDNKKGWKYRGKERVDYIKLIQPIGKKTVYDVEEPTTNTLIVEGVVVHNCLLGSINLTKFVLNPFTAEAKFDWANYRKVINIFTRMLDNVVEINGLPLEKQRHEIESKRRHGTGYLGLGSTITMLGHTYGDPESLAFTEEVTKTLAIESWKAGLELAIEKGPAPIMDRDFVVTKEMLYKRPEMIADGLKAGDIVKGKVLHSKYSRYMQQLASEEPELVKDLIQIGARFTHSTSIAPTGCCLSSTKIITSDGIKSYQDIMDENGIDWKTIEKTNNKQWISLSTFTLPSKENFLDESDKIWYNGHEETYQIEFEDGLIFECTSNHKLFVRVGKHVVEIEAKHLRGDEDVISY